MKKKLIEVALPLNKINAAAAKEKSIRYGHPATLHLWWARRPLAACRAVLFASLVDDPSSDPARFPTDASQQLERDRLFAILEQLVEWDNSTNEAVLQAAREEIWRSTNRNPPPIYDPFCGGGSIPIEGQRLGLKAVGSDLNPVAVLLTKALIEIPPRYSDHPAINPDARARRDLVDWKGASGLAADVRYYGNWMRDQAFERIGYFYPSIRPSGQSAGMPLEVIAWIWARTVKCPNPACQANMPLVRSFALSTKKGKEAYLDPVVDKATQRVRFEVRLGGSAVPEGTVSRRGARCLLCGEVAELDYIRVQGSAGQMSAQMIAIAAEGKGGRVFLPASEDHVIAAESAIPSWAPDTLLSTHPQYMGTPRYGLTCHRDLFTPRQLVALTTFSDLVAEARERMISDGAKPEYADAVATYLALVVSKSADYWSNVCIWRSDPKNLGIGHVFSRQAISMVWDFAEANPFSGSSGNWLNNLEWVPNTLSKAVWRESGTAIQQDARNAECPVGKPLISTDPPYYDNVPYADLSDFFYVWLRRSLRLVYPDLFGTVLVPKDSELVADSCRFGGQEPAREHFESGFVQAFGRMRAMHNHDFPMTVFYAFRQSEEVNDDQNGYSRASKGWETMLAGLIGAGFQVTGTWPMRSEMVNRTRALGSNALASSIVLVCRSREAEAPVVTEMDLQQRLRAEMPKALRTMQMESIAPVDLAQASIGPGMSIYSRYARVLGPDGKPILVRRALEIINRVLDEILAEQESEFDTDTRFALAWFQQYGMGTGTFGTADVLSRAMNIGVTGMENAGILEAKAGTVRLLKWEELPEDWDPDKDRRLTVWEMTHHLIRLMYKESDAAAARLLSKLGDDAEKARDLAYRLYQICERSKWSQEAQPYNALVVAWPNLTSEARQLEKKTSPEQLTL